MCEDVSKQKTLFRSRRIKHEKMTPRVRGGGSIARGKSGYARLVLHDLADNLDSKYIFLEYRNKNSKIKHYLVRGFPARFFEAQFALPRM